MKRVGGENIMPHFPTWFVVICILFPIIYNIYK